MTNHHTSYPYSNFCISLFDTLSLFSSPLKVITKMYLQSHSFFVPLFIILIISFPSCFSSYQEEQYDPKAYQPYFGTINNQNNNHNPTYESLLQHDENQILTRLNGGTPPTTSPKTLNVDSFGAKGDGTDDSEAFNNAWKEACSSNGSVIVVPKNRVYHLKPIKFEGPCKSDLTFKIFGTIKASVQQSDYENDRSHWLEFENLENFSVEGGGSGTINGNGKIWWQKSCKIDKSLPCVHAPTAITFTECNNLRVANLRIRNAQQMHLTFQKCVNVQALNLRVIAPGKSPNTDGIHVTGTENIHISNCLIRTGDDCISIVSGSKNVRATDIICGPGHGISIGSLGAGNSEAEVSNVLVDRARLSNTTNGVRIKTWQGGSGYAKNIIFQNIDMHNVTNPIIIDQNYCDQDDPCKEQASAVQVSSVAYKNIKGTSASKEAVKFDCSKSFPCQGIVLQDVNLVGEEDIGSAKALCDNVKLTHKGKVYPPCT